MTTYTLLDHNGDVMRRGLTAREAMNEILRHDSHDYDIRPRDDGGGFDLWVTQFSRASTLGDRPMIRSLVRAYDLDIDEATDEIALKVIEACWDGYPEAMTDEAYDAMVADLAAQDAAAA